MGPVESHNHITGGGTLPGAFQRPFHARNGTIALTYTYTRKLCLFHIRALLGNPLTLPKCHLAGANGIYSGQNASFHTPFI